MNIWPPEHVKTIWPMNPEDPDSGLLLWYQEEPGPISDPFILPDGRISRAYLKLWETERLVHMAAPGYDPAAWQWSFDAQNAPRVEYRINSLPYPLLAYADSDAYVTTPVSVFRRGESYPADLGPERPPFPVWYFERPYYASAAARVLPLFEMARIRPDDKRWVTGSGYRRNIRVWNASEAYPDMYGNLMQDWTEPNGSGQTRAYAGFTVYEFDQVRLFDWHCPFFLEVLAVNLVPSMATPLGLLAGISSIAGGQITPTTWRRRKDDE